MIQTEISAIIAAAQLSKLILEIKLKLSLSHGYLVMKKSKGNGKMFEFVKECRFHCTKNSLACSNEFRTFCKSGRTGPKGDNSRES